jgi:hypothetical protein
MRTLIILGGLAAAGLWALLGLGGWVIASALGDWAILNADLLSNDPETVIWIAWALEVVRDLGLVLLAVVWCAVLLAILAATAFGGRIMARFGAGRADGDAVRFGAHRGGPLGPASGLAHRLIDRLAETRGWSRDRHRR